MAIQSILGYFERKTEWPSGQRHWSNRLKVRERGGVGSSPSVGGVDGLNVKLQLNGYITVYEVFIFRKIF